MERTTPPYRCDIVGSFLRSGEIKRAWEAHADGTISGLELKNVEDREIRTLVSKEKKAGLHAVTDREYRRVF